MLLSVDGTVDPYKEEKININTNLDPKLFCHKFNGPGLNYEVIIGLYSGYVCSVKGPYKAGEMPDLKIALEEGLVDFLWQCIELCIGDGTYKNPVFVNSKRGNPPELKKLIAAAKARHESFNGRMKRARIFTCLRGFQHDMEFHGVCFHAMANMCQIEIELVKCYQPAVERP